MPVLRGFAQDPRLGLLFSGPASLLSCLRQSEPLRNFFLSASQGDEAWALLSMARSETGRLGVAMEGELRREVPQQVVSFDGHRLAMPCASRELLLESSARRSQEMLTTVIARRLSLLEQLRQTLDNEMSRLQLRVVCCAARPAPWWMAPRTARPCRIPAKACSGAWTKSSPNCAKREAR